MIIYSLLSVYVLWIFYLAVMSLFRAKANGTLSLPAKVLGYPILLIGVLLDAFVNIMLVSIILVELPKEWLLTKRLARHIQHGCGWRKTFAMWICSHLLNPFDPDQRGHCK